MSAAIDLPGFADPVLEAQASFRAILDAMAVPGSLHAAGAGLRPPAPLAPATAAALLTLVDGETALAVDAAASPALPWIGFHCGALPMPSAQARFLLALSCPDLPAVNAGSHEAPEEACTVILQLAALGTGARFRLSGPGLKEPAILAATGLPANFAARWAANHALFPRGVDMILCAGGTIAALPRSVRMEDA